MKPASSVAGISSIASRAISINLSTRTDSGSSGRYVYPQCSHILPVLQRVHDMGLPMGLLSNTCEAHWQWIMRVGYPQVRDWFGPVILSYEAKSMKPDSRIYEVQNKRLDIADLVCFSPMTDTTTFIPPRKRGWQTEVFVNADRLMRIIDAWEIRG